jgi:hypothetical protein
MYVRTIKRKNIDGSSVEYVQLAHNVWNKNKGFAQAQVIYSFGRREQLDIEAIKRLVNSLCRFLEPEDEINAKTTDGDLKFIKARPCGGAYVIAYNPEQAEVDRINREKTLDRLRCELDALNKPKRTKSSKAQCNLLLNKSMGRYVKELKSGKLKIDNEPPRV